MSLTPELQELLDNVIDSLVKWDLIAYMQQHPNGRVSVEELASCIGRGAEDVLRAIAELSDSRIVQFEDDGEAIYYKFCPVKAWQEHIQKFVESLADRNTRWLILNYLIEKHGA